MIGAAPAQALVTLKVLQAGPDVVVNGRGSAKTAGLTSMGTEATWTNVLSPVQVYAGPAAFSDGNVSLWSNLSGPSSFGSDPAVFEYPDPGSTLSFGKLFGILTSSNPADIRLVLPSTYVSGTTISGRTTYTNVTLAQLGLTSGLTYTWSWGSGPTADSLELQIDPTPVPAPLPIAGAAAAFHSVQRLRRRLRPARAMASGGGGRSIG
ncbi:MAG: hypothetical protein ACK522_15310 [Synechococcaceae cyanobacterium]